MIDYLIITAWNLFTNVIIHNSIPLSDIPVLQLSTIRSSLENESLEYVASIKHLSIDAAFEELDSFIDLNNIQTKENLLTASTK